MGGTHPRLNNSIMFHRRFTDFIKQSKLIRGRLLLSKAIWRTFLLAIWRAWQWNEFYVKPYEKISRNWLINYLVFFFFFMRDISMGPSGRRPDLCKINGKSTFSIFFFELTTKARLILQLFLFIVPMSN